MAILFFTATLFMLLNFFVGVLSCNIHFEHSVVRKSLVTSSRGTQMVPVEVDTIISYVHVDVPPDSSTNITFIIKKNETDVADLTILENANREVAGVKIGFWKGTWDRLQLFGPKSGPFRFDIERFLLLNYTEKELNLTLYSDAQVKSFIRYNEATAWGKNLTIMAQLPKEVKYSSFVFWKIPSYTAHGRTQKVFEVLSSPQEPEAATGNGYGNTTFLFQTTTIILAICNVILAATLGHAYLCCRRRSRDAEVNTTSESVVDENFASAVDVGDNIYYEPEPFGPTAVDAANNIYCEPESFGPPAVDAGDDIYLKPKVPTFDPPAVAEEIRHKTERYYENC